MMSTKCWARLATVLVLLANWPVHGRELAPGDSSVIAISAAEWEFAARAGNGASYTFGEDKSQLGRHAWYEGNAGVETRAVGQLQSNAYGLYDMHGNVWEWTADGHGSNYVTTLPVDFAREREDFCYRVIRGGSVLNFPKYLTSFYRTSLTR